MNEKKVDGWNPYLSGALAGVLAIASVVVSTKLIDSPKYLGASTTFVRTAGYLQKLVVPGYVDNNAYMEKTNVKIGRAHV